MSEPAAGTRRDTEGQVLRENNERIVRLMALLKQQRNEMNYLIKKQQEEKNKIENEIERLSFKLSLLTKSLNQRLQATANYDRTIREIDENYTSLVEESERLLSSLTKQVQELEQIMDKKTSTGSAQVSGQPRGAKKSLTQEQKTTIREVEEKQEGNTDDSVKLQKRKSSPSQDGSRSASIASDKSPERRRSSVVEEDEGEEAAAAAAAAAEEEEEEEEGESRSSTDEKIRGIKNELLEKKINKSQGEIHKQADEGMAQDNNRSYLAGGGQKNSVPPPIRQFSRQEKDIEIQNYREAYGRQHNAPSPPRSVDVTQSPPRRLSNPSQKSK